MVELRDSKNRRWDITIGSSEATCDGETFANEHTFEIDARSCSRFGRSTLRNLSLLVRSEYRELIRLCEGESDSTLCRTVLRSAKRRLRNEARQVSADLRESCGSEEFHDACNQTCRDLSASLPDCSLAALEASATAEGLEVTDSVIEINVNNWHGGSWIVNEAGEASATTVGVEEAYNPGAGIQGVFKPSDIRPPMTGATAN